MDFYGNDIRKKSEELMCNEGIRDIVRSKDYKWIEEWVVKLYFCSTNYTTTCFIIETLINELEFRERLMSDDFWFELNEENGGIL